MDKPSELKKLYVVRHGKSSWDYPGIGDIDRPLIERGISSSYRMAREFFGKNPPPDIIFTSPAIRALHTATIFSRTLEMPSGLVRIENVLYMHSDDDLLAFLYALDDSLHSVMIFGHNPGFTDLANRFLTDKIDNLPTSGLVSLTFRTGSWKDIGKNTLHTEDFDYPKKHV